MIKGSVSLMLTVMNFDFTGWHDICRATVVSMSNANFFSMAKWSCEYDSIINEHQEVYHIEKSIWPKYLHLVDDSIYIKNEEGAAGCTNDDNNFYVIIEFISNASTRQSSQLQFPPPPPNHKKNTNKFIFSILRCDIKGQETMPGCLATTPWILFIMSGTMTLFCF